VANFETAEGRTITEIEDKLEGHIGLTLTQLISACAHALSMQLNQAGTVVKAMLRNSNASK
jgi:hypothetical protein